MNTSTGGTTIIRRFLHHLLLFLLLTHSFLDVTAMSKADAQQRAQLLLTPNNTTRSIWSFAGILSNHSTNLLPPSIPQPPPLAQNYYTSPPSSTFLPLHLNGRDHYIDLTNPQQDGGYSVFTGPIGNGTKSWSLATWLYVESLTHASHVNMTVLLSCSSSHNPSPPHDFLLILDTRGRIGLRAASGKGFIYPFVNLGDSSLGVAQTLQEWIHIGIVFDNANQLYEFYYNGLLTNTISQAVFGVAYDTQAVYCKLGQSDLTVLTKDMQPFRGAFYAFAFYQGELLSQQAMWSLAAPRSAKAVLEMTPYTCKTWTLPPIPAKSNLLTSNPRYVWSQYDTLLLDSASLNLALQSPNPTVTSNKLGGSSPWSVIWWQQLPFWPASSPTQTIWSFTDSSTKDLLSVALNASAIQFTHSAFGTWNITAITQNGFYAGSSSGGTLTPVTQWTMLSIVCNGSTIASYINGYLTSTITPITPLPASHSYNTMQIGPTFVGELFGFSMFNDATTALDQPEIQALAEPTTVTFDVQGPTIVSPGSTIVLTVSMTSMLKTSGNTTLILQGGASSAHDALLTTITLTFSTQSPQTASFLVPLDVNTYTITFSNSMNDPLINAPQPWCIQVVDATPSLIMDIGLTSFTSAEFLASSDYHLELSSSSTLPASPPAQTGPSGIAGHNILTFDGVSQFLNLNGSMKTMPFLGLIDESQFTIALWIQVRSLDPVLFTTIFYHAVNTSSDYILLRIDATTGQLRFEMFESSIMVCTAASLTPFPVDPSINEWHHVTAQMGEGGCSVFLDGQQSLSVPIGITAYTSSWNKAWQPLAQSLPHTITNLGAYSSNLYPTMNGSLASFDIFQRALSPREIAFLAANKPVSLLPPLPNPRIITVPNVMSAAQLYDDALLGFPTSGGVSTTHATLTTGPNFLSASAARNGGFVWKFDPTMLGMDLFSTADTIGRGTIPKTVYLSKSQPWSVGMWIMPDNTLPGSYLFNILTMSNLSIASLTLNTNSELVFNYTIGASKTTICSFRATFAVLGSTSVSNQQWVYVHAEYNPLTPIPTCAVYLDGRMAGISQIVADPTVQQITGFILGGQAITPALPGKFYGQIASFIFFTRAVTKQEIFILGTSPPVAVLPPVLPSNLPTPAARILSNSDYDWVPTGPIAPGLPGVDLSPPGADLPDAPRVWSYSGVSNTVFTNLLVANGVSTGMTYSFPPFRSSAVTISMWTSWSASTGCFYFLTNNDLTSIVSLQPHPNSLGNVMFNVTNCGGSQCAQICQLTLNQASLVGAVDTMSHLVSMITDDGTCKLFINGILSATSSSSDINNAPQFGLRTMIPTVANVGACAGASRLNGKVAQLTIWQRELSDMEIAVLAAEPPLSVRALFPTVQQYRPTISTPLVEWTFDKNGTNYVSNNGVVAVNSVTKQYIDLLSLSDNPSSSFPLTPVFGGLSQSFTISMWLAISPQTILSNMRLLDCSSSDKLHQIIVTIENGYNYGISSSAPSYTGSFYTPVNTYLPNRWHLLTLVFEAQSSTLKVQVNSGVVSYQGAFAGLASASRLVTRSFCRIGESSNPGHPRVDFSVAYVAFHNIALQPQDVSTMFRNPPMNVVPLLNGDSTINRLLASAAAAYTFPTSPTISGSSPSYISGILTFTPNSTFAPQYLNLLTTDNTGSFANALPLNAISNLVGGGVTLTMWLKFTNILGNQRVFDIVVDGIDTRFSIEFNNRVVTIVIHTTGQSMCSLSFLGYLVAAGIWNLYTIILLPDARGLLYIDSFLKDSSSSSMQCASSSSTNVAQTLLLPIGVFSTAYFGGVPSAVDGVTYRGFYGSLAGLFYFTRQLLSSEIALLYQNPPVVGLIGAAVSTLPSSYFWRFQLASQSGSGYALQSSSNTPGSYAKFYKNTYLNLVSLADRPMNDQILTTPIGGVLGKATVLAMWMRFDGLGSLLVPTPGTLYSLFDFSISGVSPSSRLLLSLQFNKQNQTFLQYDQVKVNGGTSISFASQPGVVKLGEWKLITLVITLALTHPTGSNIRLYVNAGLVAMSPTAYAQSIPTTRAFVNQNPDVSVSGLPISLADVTIINSTDSYTHAMVVKAWLSPPQSLKGSPLLNSPADALLRSSAALYTCSPRLNSKTTTSIMDWIPGRSSASGLGLCRFDRRLATSSDEFKNGSYWDLTNPNDNPDHSIMPQFTTDPRIVGDGGGFTFSFHMSLKRLPIQNEVMPLLTCKTSSTDSDDIYISMAYQTTTSTSFTVQIVSQGVGKPVVSLRVVVQNIEIPTDEVIHLAVSFVSIDATPSWQTQIHFNGRLIDSTAKYSGLTNAISFSQRDICFFGLNRAYLIPDSSTQFLGSVGQIAFFSRGLSTNEIQLLAINPPAAYVSQTTVTSLTYSGSIQHYINRPLTCASRGTLQHFQTWDSENTATMNTVENVPTMQCEASVVVSAAQAKGKLNSTLINCIRTTALIPIGESLSYVGMIPSEARLEVNPLWLGIDSTYVRTQIEDIGIFIGPNLGSLQDITSLLTPPSSPLSIFNYQMYLPAFASTPLVWILTYCVSPCAYYYKGNKLADGQSTMQLAGLSVGVNVVKLYTTSISQAMNYSITLIMPPPDVCYGVTCANGGTCLQQASQQYPGYAFTCQCVGLYNGPTCQDVIVPPTKSPVAVMFAAQTVTDCDTLSLDGTQSYNLGPASLHPRWIWSLVSIRTGAGVEIVNTSSPTYDPVVAAQTFAGAQPNTLNASTIFTQDSLIPILGSRLIGNCTYRFSLQIMNDIDQSQPVWKDVTKQTTAQVAWTPSLVVRVPSPLRRPNSVITTASLTPSTCMAYPLDLVYSYTWQAQITGALYPPSDVHPPINLIAPNQIFIISQASSFVVPAGFWRTGYTYTISLNLVLSSASGISPTQRRRLLASQSVALNYLQTNLTVTSTAVVAKITNGDRTRANTDELIITADQSYDPDFPLSTGQSPLIGVTFMWSCRVSGGIGCALPATVNLTRPSVLVPPSTLAAGYSYIWSVTVTSLLDSRSSSASANVTLTVPLAVTSPLVAILAPPERINIDDELRVQATVVTTTNTSAIAMLYVWTIALDNSSLPAVLLPSLFDPANLASGVGVNTSSLVLLSNRLVSGVYRLTVTVTDPLTIDPLSGVAVTGYASIIFRVNSKPQPGECHISATSGYAFLTPFSVVCSSWYSTTGDEPFTYQISYATSEAVAAATAANTPVSYLQLTPASFAPTSVQFFLPSGSLIIRATITDQVGSQANIDLLLTVDAPVVVFDLLEYIRNLTEVQLPPLVASGSTQPAMLLSSRIGELINGARVTMSADTTAQDRLTLYTSECLTLLSQSWKQTLTQTQNNIDLASMNLIIQAMLPLTKYAATRYSNDTLSVALQLASDVIHAADVSTTPSILSVSSTQNLGLILSQLFVRCDQLDFIDHSIHTVLRIRQRDAVAGEEISLSTRNFIGFVSRSLVSAGTEVHLSNGQSVILTSQQMQNYVSQLEHLNSSSIDTASYPLGTAEMDTRIVTFASQWNQCRSSDSLSQLTSIELTFPNGDPIDIGSLGHGIVFTLPIPKNASDPILQRIQEDQRRQYEERCGTMDGYTATNTTQDELLQHFKCQFYNTTTHQYSTDGCETLNVSRIDPPGLGGLGGVLLTCQCSHLTEFAILFQEASSRQHDGDDGCPEMSNSLGDSSYLVFLVLYALVGLAALIQLIRSIVFFGAKKYWLITIEHTLMFLMCLARSFNMTMYYSLYTHLSIFTQSLLSGIPYLFYPWIFTFVIVAWASVLAAASQGLQRENLFQPYAIQFILGNSIISLVIFFIFISMSLTQDLHTLTQLQRAGIGVTCAVEIGFAIFFVVYGGLLVHELTKSFVSKHAWRLGAIAGSLASAFAISAALLAFSVAQPDRYGEHFVAYNCVYFSLDIVGLLIVMALFAKSISRGDTQSKTKEVSTSNPSSHRTGVNGKTPTNGRSTNGNGSKKGVELGTVKRAGTVSKLSMKRAPPPLPVTQVPGNGATVASPSPSPPPLTIEQDDDVIQQYTPPAENMILQVSPPQSPHHHLDVMDSSAVPDDDDDDDVPLPPPPLEQSQFHPHPVSPSLVQNQQQRSAVPPPLPSSSKRPPPPIPQQQTPASPSQVAISRLHQPHKLEEVHVEQQQLEEDDF